MPSYTLHAIAPPTITLEHHTFQFRIFLQDTGDAGPFLRAVGQITFQKPPHESWQAAASRFVQTVYDWLATYEQATDIDSAISTWLDTHTWNT